MHRLTALPRTALTVAVGVLATLVAGSMAIVLGRISPTSRHINGITAAWSRAWLLAAGSSLQVAGRHHVDRDRSYVVVANHSSNLDVMACFLALPVPVRFLAKADLFRIPLFGSAMRAIGIVEVDRGGRSAIHDQMNRQAEQMVSLGRSLIVFPEGTRAREGRLLAFKKGAFTMAVSSGLAILPVTIVGAARAWPPEAWWVRGGPIEVFIDPPIETAGLNQGDTSLLRDQVRQLIADRLVGSN